MKYRVVVQTVYGSLTVEVIADTEREAFDNACEYAKDEINCAKIGSIEVIE